MGTADRDYFRDEARRYSGAPPPVTPVTKWLLIVNIAVFVLDLLVTNQALVEHFSFSINQGLLGGKVWQFITFQFLHADAGHLIFNMMALWLFGRWVEAWWGSRRFLIFYLLCGVAGPLFYALLNTAGILGYGSDGNIATMVGASAGIYGCMVGAAVVNPQGQVQLMFMPWNFTIRKIALIMLGVAAGVVLINFLAQAGIFKNGGGEAAHLGGALAAYGMMRFPQLLRRGAEDSSKIVRPKEFRRKKPRRERASAAVNPNAKLRPRTTLDTATASEVDRILDKINREGLQSLTAKEQEILNEAGRSRRDR